MSREQDGANHGPRATAGKRKLVLPGPNRKTPGRYSPTNERSEGGATIGTSSSASAISHEPDSGDWGPDEAAILAAMPTDTEAALRLLTNQFHWHGKVLSKMVE